MKPYVDVLGTRYTIESKTKAEDPLLAEADGYCDDYLHKIVLLNPENETPELKNQMIKHVLRHEIIHAFLSESGLRTNAGAFNDSWANNEEMVDFFAIQFPKILDAYKWVDCL